MDRALFLDVLKDSYSAYYNIIEDENLAELPMSFRADYFSRAEQYWLSKKIKVWGNETNEFCYVFSAESFDNETVDKCVKAALDESLPRVKPHKEHQYSNVKVLFVADSFDKAVKKHIQAKKFEKSYKFSLHGFTMLKTCAVDLTAEDAYPNKAGYELAKYFQKLFAARKED